jgi:hypothetical protein
MAERQLQQGERLDAMAERQLQQGEQLGQILLLLHGVPPHAMPQRHLEQVLDRGVVLSIDAQVALIKSSNRDAGMDGLVIPLPVPPAPGAANQLRWMKQPQHWWAAHPVVTMRKITTSSTVRKLRSILQDYFPQEDFNGLTKDVLANRLSRYLTQ